MSFVHLHVYSSYSLLTSTISIEQLVHAARKREFPAIALTDYNVMYGVIAFYKECLRQRIKPIIGLTADVQCMDGEKYYPLVLLAKNNAGYQNLLKITSAIQISPKKGLPEKWLKAYADGLISITPGKTGEVETYLLAEEWEKAEACVERLKNIFGKNNFYIGIQNHGEEREKELNEKLIPFAKERDIELVATNHVHYLDKEDAFAQECLLAIKNGHKLQDPDREKLPSDEYYLKSELEMEQLFKHVPEAIKNTLKIADACNVMIDLKQNNLPKFPVEENQTAEQLLEDLCLKGLKERYGDPKDIHYERLQYELKIINNMNFADYFLIVWDFVRFARERGITIGPGRGSAAGSIVSYVLYITDVDPIKHNLLFERFLNPERISMPDIDIDFPDNRRDEVIEYVAKKYGDLRVAQIITFGTLAAKAVLRDVGRIFGLDSKTLDRLSRTVPSELGLTLKKAYEQSEGLRKFVQESPLHERLFLTACKLEGLPRHTSTHAAGVVISEKPLVETIPIQKGQGVYLTQYSMEHLEELGLLKMDFLGLRNLTLMENIVDAIYRTTKCKINIPSIPLNDKKTFELLSRGETTGVFQLESEGMRNVLKRLKPTRFEDIVAVNALYRPGPMENIPTYIQRKHGKEPIHYPHQDLQPILENTYGVIVYQEQIMQIAAKMAGFSLGEADLLRRAVSKKQKEVLDRERGHFVSGALKKGYDEKTANEIYDLIVKFSNYGFNRSHAVAYSFIAYQLAYLKAHYPLHFMSALLTSAIGNDRKIAQYVRESKEMGIDVLPPSINKSGYSFTVEGDKIRFSLAAIKGVGITALREIFRARKRGKFTDLFDFCLQVSLKTMNRKVLEALVHSGSFDEFGQDRAVLLASLDRAIKHVHFVRPEGYEQGDLFSEEETMMIKPIYADVEPIPIQEKLRFEKEVLGLYLSNHPVSTYKPYFQLFKISPLQKMKEGTSVQRIIADVIEVKKIRTKRGDSMAFLTISDESGEMEAVAFPAVFRRLSFLLEKGNILIFEGKMERRNEKKQFIIENGYSVDDAIKNIQETERTLYLRIKKGNNGDKLAKIKDIIQAYPGHSTVIIYFAEERKTERLGSDEKVAPTLQCISDLEKVIGRENIVLQ